VTLSERKYRKRVSLGQSNNALTTLIVINIILFVILAFVKMFWYLRYEDNQAAVNFFNEQVVSWFAMPADFGKLMSQPWSLVTHMFVHVSFWQVIANMLWLWCFGYIMQDLTGNGKLVPVFIYGALAGAIGFMLAYNLIPALHDAMKTASFMGASTGVMAIAVATTLVAPRYKLFPMINGGLPLWILTAVYLIIDFATIQRGDWPTMIAHLSGALAGVLFMFFLRRGYDGSEWMNNFADWLNNLFNPDRPRKGKNIKEELFYRSAGAPYKKTPNITQQRIDEILDKINQKGYNSLTEEEKELLKRASQDL
jgi:membrane associated rhomboid family serine protease